ncbi:Uncharacterised protein [uncultured archaeon]|nr:Uncharacterised protein [uncultured archaeon]
MRRNELISSCIAPDSSFVDDDIITSSPPDFIADACTPRKYVEAMRRLGYSVLYINEINGRMPDSEIIEMGGRLGIPIATQNIRHFGAYGKLIPLKSRKNVRRLVRETLRHLSKK